MLLTPEDDLNALRDFNKEYEGKPSKLEEMQARVNYDLDYLRRWSPMLDLKILFQTFLKLFHDRKAY